MTRSKSHIKTWSDTGLDLIWVFLIWFRFAARHWLFQSVCTDTEFSSLFCFNLFYLKCISYMIASWKTWWICGSSVFPQTQFVANRWKDSNSQVSLSDRAVGRVVKYCCVSWQSTFHSVLKLFPDPGWCMLYMADLGASYTTQKPLNSSKHVYCVQNTVI